MIQLSIDDQKLLEYTEGGILRLQQEPDLESTTTPFCTAHNFELVSELVQKYSLSVRFWGGYEKAVKKIGNISRTQTYVNPSVYQLSCYRFEWQRFDVKPKIRELKRILADFCSLSALGDILEDTCVELIVTINARARIEENRTELSTLLKCIISEIKNPAIEPRYGVAKDVFVASNRLDGIISKIFRLPRSESNDAISMGYIAVNSKRETNPDRKLSSGSEIFFKTKGIVKVESQTESKRGRLCVKYSELQTIHL